MRFVGPTTAWDIPSAKLLNYLLDVTHEKGGPKARYLIRFGFTPEDPTTLGIALVDHALGNGPGKVAIPQKGPMLLVFEGTVVAPDGRDMPLRTVWEPRNPPAEMRFITAVPLTR